MRYITIAIFMALGSHALADGQRLLYPCHRPASAPTIDGDVTGDPAWATIPSVTGFRVLGADYAHAKQTTAWLCWDNEAIYVAVVAEEPDAAELQPVAADGGWTWGEDSIEVFIQPGGQGQAYQIGVTTAGARGSGAGNPDITACRSAAAIGTDTYSIELSIPYGVLNARTPADGDAWLGTVCRNTFITTSGGDKFTTWAPLRNAFLEPENYGEIRFVGRTLTPEQAAAGTAAMSSEYRERLIGKLADAAERMEQYVGDLREAASDRRFRRDALRLLRRWRGLKGMQEQGRGAATAEVRKALGGVDAMVAAAYELKYAYLLTKLTDEQ